MLKEFFRWNTSVRNPSLLTIACDSVSEVTMVTAAIECALGVGTVGLRVTIVRVSSAFFNIFGDQEK